MSVYSRSSDRRKILSDYQMRDEDFPPTYARHGSMSPSGQLDKEKKMRREIANSNERRRMQSINAGFQALKQLIPHHDGDKLSKAAILQQTTEYIQALQQDKDKLLVQNAHLKRMLTECDRERLSEVVYHDSPPPKRKKRDTECSDEGISQDYDEQAMEDRKRQVLDLRCQLDRDQRLRLMMEDEVRKVDAQVYPAEHIPQFTPHMNMQAQMQKDKMMYMVQMEEEDRKMKSDKDEDSVSESMSRRNLQTIVEAIQHLEGEGLAFDDRKPERRHIPNSADDSEKESVITSESEDIKSESSDRDSPFSYVHERQTVTINSTSQGFQQKYPVASTLLHGALGNQLYCRPGVIVQKS